MAALASVSFFAKGSKKAIVVLFEISSCNRQVQVHVQPQYTLRQVQARDKVDLSEGS